MPEIVFTLINLFVVINKYISILHLCSGFFFDQSVIFVIYFCYILFGFLSFIVCVHICALCNRTSLVIINS